MNKRIRLQPKESAEKVPIETVINSANYSLVFNDLFYSK